MMAIASWQKVLYPQVRADILRLVLIGGSLGRNQQLEKMENTPGLKLIRSTNENLLGGFV